MRKAAASGRTQQSRAAIDDCRFMWRVPRAGSLDAWVYRLSKRTAASTATGA